MKKLLILLSVLLLCSCGTKQEQPIDEVVTKEFIEPVNEVEVFEYLNEETKSLLLEANNGNEIKTHLLELLGKELINYELTDYYGNKINLANYKDKKLIIELAANWCTHCMKQSKEYNDELLKTYDDICFIQYFNDGDKEEIDGFYSQIDKTIPNNVVVIPEDKDFSNEILSKYNPEYYPAFLIFDHGKLTWIAISELTKDQMAKAYDIAFNSGLNLKDLTDESGKSIFTYTRTKDDVKKDLGEEKYKLIEELDNDNYTINNTLAFIGSDIDYLDQLEDDSYFESEVTFADYIDKDAVIIYMGDLQDDVISMINDFTDGHPELDVIVMDVYDENVDTLKEQLTAKVCSIMNQIPKSLNEITFNSYPSCVFVKKGTVVGCYSNIEDLIKFNLAAETFIGENSIAYK